MATQIAIGFAIFALPFHVFSQSPNALAWAANNQYIEIAAGAHRQNYREQDPQGVGDSGILDSETGRQETVAAVLSWQLESGVLLRLKAARQSGATDYRGYLQANNGTRIPYEARSGNLANQYSLGIGYAFNTSNWSALPESVQIAPVLQISQSRWQRNLVQYSETYAYRSVAGGAMIQWQARSGTVAELQALSGRNRSASVSVPSLDFDANQPGGKWQEWQIGIRQNLTSFTDLDAFMGWSASIRYMRGHQTQAASPVVNHLQAPANEHNISSWMLGVQKQF